MVGDNYKTGARCCLGVAHDKNCEKTHGRECVKISRSVDFHDDLPWVCKTLLYLTLPEIARCVLHYANDWCVDLTSAYLTSP